MHLDLDNYDDLMVAVNAIGKELKEKLEYIGKLKRAFCDKRLSSELSIEKSIETVKVIIGMEEGKEEYARKLGFSLCEGFKTNDRKSIS